MLDEGLLGKANERAQRRLRAMVVAKAYPDPNARETRLYVQAERLFDSLLVEAQWEAQKAEFDAMQAADHDVHGYDPSCSACWAEGDHFAGMPARGTGIDLSKQMYEGMD